MVLREYELAEDCLTQIVKNVLATACECGVFACGMLT